MGCGMRLSCLVELIQLLSRSQFIWLCLQREDDGQQLDLSDDEELKEALDVHAIVSPMVPHSATDEDINADDVIQEIDTIMKVSASPCQAMSACHDR